MKRYFILVLLIGFSSCTTDNSEEVIALDASKISGDWQVISETYSVGGPEITTSIESGAIYSFGQNSLFEFNYANDKTLNFSGSYNFDEDILTMSYSVDGMVIKRSMKVFFEEDEVVFIPWNPTCIEGCSTRLQKVIYLED